MSQIAPLFTSANYSDRVAAEVRALAARHNVQYKDLATVLGLPRSGITNRMKGRVAFTLDELFELAQLFQVEVSDLMPKTQMASATAGVALASENGREATESASELPRLDLNQQPCDYGTSQMAAVFRLNLPPAYVEVDDSSPHPIAPVVPLHSDEPVVTKRTKKPTLHPESGVHVARQVAN